MASQTGKVLKTSLRQTGKRSCGSGGWSNYDQDRYGPISFDYWTRKISTPQLPVTFDFVEVSFNAVHDADRRQALNDIGTNFKLKDDEVDLLIEAADEVLRSSPEFRSFLARINGQRNNQNYEST